MNMRRIVPALAVIALAGSALAQVVGDGVALPDPEGVYLDPAGVLRARAAVDEKAVESLRRRALAANPKRERVSVSLPGAIARAAELRAKGEALPDELRYMRGIVKIDSIEIDAEHRDLRLVGFAEPIEKTAGHRVFGATSGRPVVQLDDVVAALRLFAVDDRWDDAAGCTIQLSKEGADAFVEEFRRLSTVIAVSEHRQRHGIAAALAKAGGEQAVEFIGQPGDTRFARVCIDADFELKRIAMGLQKPAFAMPSYISMVHKPEPIVDRFWFEQGHEALAVSEDGRSVSIRGPSLAVRTQKHAADADPRLQSPAAERFAKVATAQIEKLERFSPAFADLANLSDLALLAAVIGRDRLDQRVGWDLAAAIAPERYTTQAMPVPRSVPLLANWNEHEGTLVFVAGGVRLEYAAMFRR